MLQESTSHVRTYHSRITASLEAGCAEGADIDAEECSALLSEDSAAILGSLQALVARFICSDRVSVSEFRLRWRLSSS